jgi:hypothetical protein
VRGASQLTEEQVIAEAEEFFALRREDEPTSA